ncbi:MAG TPA: chemotaxis response regulator protein-glutamate methylesterase [Polyangiaceae bacterium]|nr:chemotaxis response regulator protein-glutamate methylesterase [Polyangiaceae bacterium]
MKIAIVNDSTLATEALRSAVMLKPEHQLLWTAKNGVEAVEKCARQTPDLVLMDLLMPEMGGVEATRRIMSSSPCAIVIVTASVKANTSRVFEAMGYGALDAVDTPALGLRDPRVGAAALLKKIETIKRLLGSPNASGAASGPSQARHLPEAGCLVAIGASAGGPAALATVLRALPSNFRAAIAIVQHVDAQFASGMAEWLSGHCALPVRIARHGERPAAGSVLLAGTQDHLRLAGGGRLEYAAEQVEYAHRPSIDVFFRSVSELWPGEAVGVVLTGMGADGALGLKALRDKGHHTIAQDQATSAVYGMPKAAASLGAAVEVLPVTRIATRLVEICARKV